MKKNYKFLVPFLIAIPFQNIKAQCAIPSSVTATPSVVCAGETTSLNATALGSAINWYTVPTAGTPIGSSLSGADFTVNPTSNTTYYAESFEVGTNTFSYTGSLQTYTVPTGVTQITIEARGAQGGDNISLTNLGGKGAQMIGTFTTTPGQVLNIIVGQKGFNATSGNAFNGAGGGGGGSFVYLPAALQPLIAAGGGGGSSLTNNGIPHYYGKDGVTTTNGSGSRSDDSFNDSPGGTGGANGTSVCGAGGKGWNTIMTNPAGVTGAAYGGNGGYGGGGANGVSPNPCNHIHTAGGGGGYSGGGAGGSCYYYGGGGGGSYNVGTNQMNTAGFQSGDGLVIITVPSCVSASRTAVSVSVNPNPTVAVNSGSICLGNSFTITPSGASTYTIEGGNAIVSPTTNSTYTVIGTSSLGCVSDNVLTSTVNVSANPLPTITVNSGSICSGSSFTINPSGALTYTIEGGNAVVSPTASSSYTVIGTNSLGCVSQTYATSDVSVTPSPIVSVTGNTFICNGQVTILNATGADTYSWSSGPTTSSISVSPSVTTSYIAMGTSSTTGCTGTKTITITVSNCTGIDSNTSINGIQIYPVPNDGVFVVELNNSLEKTIELFDINGKTVYLDKSIDNKININIKSLPNGIYYVKIKTDNSVHVLKVIKE
ncbi:MAG: T9SS type A sorting domain-containing protein [Bacteroidia bacterium]